MFRVDAEEGNRDRWLDSVVLRVRDARAIDRGSLELPLQVTNESFPIEWGLLATEKDRGASIEVIAEGRRGGAVQSQQRALVSFVSERVVRIDLFLARACTVQRVEYCRTLVPGVELTCGRAGQCELAQRSGGTALDRDAEASVAFVDATAPDVVLASPDAERDGAVSAPDASDAGRLDADAAMDATPTDTGVPPIDTGVPPIDTGVPPIDTGVPPIDTGVPPADTGVPPADTGVPPADTGVPPADSGCITRVVINEVQVFDSDPPPTPREYIELHNAGTCAVSLNNWRIVTRTGAGAFDLFTFGPAHSIAPGGYVVVADSAHPSVPSASLRWMSNSVGYLGNTVGGLRLLDHTGAVVDRVGWAEGAMVDPGAEYVEGSWVSYVAGRAILTLARSPNGQDTNRNNVDFVFSATVPSPGARNM